MKHRRDPRRGLPSSDELTKTNEPLDKKQTKVAEHDAIEKPSVIWTAAVRRTNPRRREHPRAESN
jgi:hypothetical protein